MEVESIMKADMQLGTGAYNQKYEWLYQRINNLPNDQALRLTFDKESKGELWQVHGALKMRQKRVDKQLRLSKRGRTIFVWREVVSA